MDEPDDPLPALRAELDQTLMLAPELARMARTYFAAFETEGFSKSQSVYLTAALVVQNPGQAP